MSVLQSGSSACAVARCSPRGVLQHAVVRPGRGAVRVLPRICQQPTLSQRIVVHSASDSTVSNAGGTPGQLSIELMEAMQAKITEALEAQRVSVSDVYGDGRHVNIDVVSDTFEGKSSVQRQRLVYKAIWLELQDAVHAVDSMSTKTPAEAGL